MLREICRCWHGDETIRRVRARSTRLKKGFCATDSRTTEQLDPHGRALLLRSTIWTEETWNFSPRATDGNSSFHESVAHDDQGCGACEQTNVFSHHSLCNVDARQETSIHSELMRSRRHKMFHSVCSTLEIQRHHDSLR